MPLLAQYSPLNPPAPAPLPAPPLLEHLILEQPLPLAGPFVLGGLVLIWMARHSTPVRRWRAVAGGLLLAGAPVIFLLAHWVETDRERMGTATALLVEATAKANTARMDEFLAPDCCLFSRFGFPGYRNGGGGMDKATILDQVPRTIQANPISGSRILQLQAQSRGPGVGTTQLLVKVVVEAERSGYKLPVQSWWKVDWRRDGNSAWRATAIEAMSDPAGVGR